MVLELCDEDGCFRGEKCLRRRLTCRGLRVKLRHVYMSSSDSWMHMDPVGLGKDVFGLFFSA